MFVFVFLKYRLSIVGTFIDTKIQRRQEEQVLSYLKDVSVGQAPLVSPKKINTSVNVLVVKFFLIDFF